MPQHLLGSPFSVSFPFIEKNTQTYWGLNDTLTRCCLYSLQSTQSEVWYNHRPNWGSVQPLYNKSFRSMVQLHLILNIWKFLLSWCIALTVLTVTKAAIWCPIVLLWTSWAWSFLTAKSHGKLLKSGDIVSNRIKMILIGFLCKLFFKFQIETIGNSINSLTRRPLISVLSNVTMVK